MVNRRFLRFCLENFEFPRQFVNLNASCISTVAMSLICNGDILNEFVPIRGIRQGDPLSPYLFVLYLENLSMMINKDIAEEKWRPLC